MIEAHNVSSADLGLNLRTGVTGHLRRRRTITRLLMFASANLAVVALYQIGAVKRLPQPKWRGLDAEKINGSAQAYSWLSTPDGFLGLASYSASACLVAAGSETRWRDNPLLPVCMTAKLFGDAAYAGKLTLDEIFKYEKVSIWSLGAAVAAFAALPFAFPEFKDACRHLLSSDRERVE
jgi:hypothetical protein